MHRPSAPSPRICTHLPLVTALIPNWNGCIDTLECLESLRQLEYPKSQMEIIIIDNGSQDGSCQAIKGQFTKMRGDGWAKLELVELPENVGIPQAYNLGYQRGGEDAFAILRLESDVVLTPKCVRGLVDVLMENEDVGIVGPKNIRFGSEVLSCGGANYYSWCTSAYHTCYPEEPVICDSVQGNCILIRRALVGRLKYLFDGSLVMMTDETDLMFRARKVGYRTMYTPKVSCLHKEGQSTGKVVGNTLLYYAVRNGVLLHRRHNPYPYRLLWYLWTLGYAIISLAKNRRVVVRAIIEGFCIKQ